MLRKYFFPFIFLSNISWGVFIIQPWLSDATNGDTDEGRLVQRRSLRGIFQRATQAQSFRILESSEIYSALVELSQSYRNFATLVSAQELFDLPAAGGSSDCPYEPGNTAGCRNWILTIEDKLAHPKGSSSHSTLPEVFISGALHGNERVGPTAALKAASLLLQAVDCEAAQISNSTSSGAIACRTTLGNMGINAQQRQWLARLVTTRRIVIVPMTNALGYYRNIRTEYSLDPNRDFPFEQDPNQCMQTIAARTVNELFRSHIFQLSLTFHAGTEVVAYEWGNPSYWGYLSPDDFAQGQIARAYSQYAGKFGNTPSYPYGTLNDLVYPVNGGMEDWAYGASWDSTLVTPCTPETFGGYNRSKTIYNDSVLRAFNILVETSDQKTPSASSLGSMQDLLDPNSVGNGHIARNIRISLLMIEAVEPYVRILAAGGKTLPNDIVPAINRQQVGCASTRVLPKASSVSIDWTVGGSFVVEETYLIYGPKSVFSQIFNCSSRPTEASLQAFLADNSSKIKSTATQQGRTQWHANGAYPTKNGSASRVVFTSSLDLSGYNNNATIVVVALAKVDQSWSRTPSNIVPTVGPQSHMANVRTNPKWSHQNAGVIVQGRLTWISIPLSFQVKQSS